MRQDDHRSHRIPRALDTRRRRPHRRCGDSKPTWPAKAPSLAGLDHEKACAVVAARAKPCTDQLMVVDMMDTGAISAEQAEQMVNESGESSAEEQFPRRPPSPGMRSARSLRRRSRDVLGSAKLQGVRDVRRGRAREAPAAITATRVGHARCRSPCSQPGTTTSTSTPVVERGSRSTE